MGPPISFQASRLGRKVKPRPIFPRFLTAQKTNGPLPCDRGPFCLTVKETARKTRGCSAAGTSRRSRSSVPERSSSLHRPAGSSGAYGSSDGDGGSTSWGSRPEQRSSSARQPHSSWARPERRTREPGQRTRARRRSSWSRSKSACSSGAYGSSDGDDGSTSWGSRPERRSSSARKPERHSTTVPEHNTRARNNHHQRCALAHPRRWPQRTGRRRAGPAAQCGISWNETPKQKTWGTTINRWSTSDAWASGARWRNFRPASSRRCENFPKGETLAVAYRRPNRITFIGPRIFPSLLGQRASNESNLTVLLTSGSRPVAAAPSAHGAINRSRKM